jgi:hypothetical protein
MNFSWDEIQLVEIPWVEKTHFEKNSTITFIHQKKSTTRELENDQKSTKKNRLVYI